MHTYRYIYFYYQSHIKDMLRDFKYIILNLTLNSVFKLIGVNGKNTNNTKTKTKLPQERLFIFFL